MHLYPPPPPDPRIYKHLAVGSLTPSRHMRSHPCLGTLSPNPSPPPTQAPHSYCSCCWAASTAVPTPGSMPPSAAVSLQSCAACSVALGGAPHPAWGPKRSPVPLPAPSWPRTLPPEKPGGAFLPKAPRSSAACQGLVLAFTKRGGPTGNWLQISRGPGGLLLGTRYEGGLQQHGVWHMASTPGSACP